MYMNYIFDVEPAYLLQTHYYQILKYAYTHHYSDLSFQSGCPVMAVKDGRNIQLTMRSLTHHEAEDVTNLLYGSNAVAKVLTGTDIDFSYVLPDKDKCKRFRVNATMVHYGSSIGVQLSLRIMPMILPTLDALNFPDKLAQLSYVREGIVIICGATGSGKSTLLASMMTERAQKSQLGEKIITFESPIEYLLPAQIGHSIIAQSEIPRYLPSYSYAVKNALRRTPTAIMVGESRDKETLLSVIESAMTGHAVYSTVHSQSVIGALSRILLLFPSNERDRVLYDLLSSLRAIIWQSLLPRSQGGRVALREYILFDQHFTYSQMSINKLDSFLESEMTRQKSTRQEHLLSLYQQGEISQETFYQYSQSFKADKGEYSYAG
ncbi:Flp pilus assembly complex ATPase component TadA [Fangia hongkongensis]|nr:Flp pilus assembly complex ATPase component TadA [Fangia hongkongensis]